MSYWCNVNHLLLANWQHQWPHVNCVLWHFVATSFFLVDGYAYSRSFCRFSGVITVHIFSSVNKIVLTSLGECFFCFEWLSLAWKFASLSFRSLWFLNTNISLGSDLFGVLNYCFARNLLLSLSLKEFWNQLAFGIVNGKIDWHLFSGYGVYMHDVCNTNAAKSQGIWQ